MAYEIERLSNLGDLVNYLNDVDTDFGIPLSNKVSIDSFAEKLIKHGIVLVIRNNDEIISCIGFYCNDIIERFAYLPILSTKKSARGKGFARLLILQMLKECKAKKMRAVFCDSINSHAISLYKSIGFIEYKREGEKSFLEYRIE